MIQITFLTFLFSRVNYHYSQQHLSYHIFGLAIFQSPELRPFG